MRTFLTLFALLAFTLPCYSEDSSPIRPTELDVLRSYLGVWDAEIEVWTIGPDSPSITFLGVETNRAYGEYWIASDFDSEFQGQEMKIHSIVGYDLDKQLMVGTVIDHGPYAAKLVGNYDKDSQTVFWTTTAKMPNGHTMIQQTEVTQKSADERVLVLMIPAEEQGKYRKMMEIRFKKRP